MIDYKRIISNTELRLKIIQCLRFIPDIPYLKMVYWIKTGKKLNLNPPITFCDKMNWLKLYDVHPEYTDLADKIKVREHVKSILGKDICIPLLGWWDNYDAIDFNSLPNEFVLKCNHDSGSVKVIHDKEQIDHKALKKFYTARLKENSFVDGREYPYRDIKPCILAEKYMVPDGSNDIEDYKFFCFNGEPVILVVATDRSTDCKFDFYDMDFNHLDIVNIHPQSGRIIEKPKSFEEMKEIARKLSAGMKFVRMDLYEIEGKVYFGEYTFYHAGGFWPMHPDEWEIRLGDLIKI